MVNPRSQQDTCDSVPLDVKARIDAVSQALKSSENMEKDLPRSC
jgi:hypothetical protein